jgi:hypothetical protein
MRPFSIIPEEGRGPNSCGSAKRPWWIMRGIWGYPATVEIRRYGDTGKVFISKPPLELQKSFAEVMMNWEENRPAKRPWARCGDEERGGVKDSGMED